MCAYASLRANRINFANAALFTKTDFSAPLKLLTRLLENDIKKLSIFGKMEMKVYNKILNSAGLHFWATANSDTQLVKELIKSKTDDSTISTKHTSDCIPMNIKNKITRKINKTINAKDFEGMPTSIFKGKRRSLSDLFEYNDSFLDINNKMINLNNLTEHTNEDEFQDIFEQFNKIEEEIKEHEKNSENNKISPFDRKLDIIDLNRSYHTKSVSGKIYNILVESGFDKDFNSHEKKNNKLYENRKKEEIIKTSGRIWKLTIPNYYKDKLITMNMSGFKTFKVLYKLGYIQQLTCFFCSGELSQSHITFDCMVACFYWSLFRLSLEITFKKAIEIKYDNVFNLKLDAYQGTTLTTEERSTFLTWLGC